MNWAELATAVAFYTFSSSWESKRREREKEREATAFAFPWASVVVHCGCVNCGPANLFVCVCVDYVCPRRPPDCLTGASLQQWGPLSLCVCILFSSFLSFPSSPWRLIVRRGTKAHTHTSGHTRPRSRRSERATSTSQMFHFVRAGMRRMASAFGGILLLLLLLPIVARLHHYTCTSTTQISWERTTGVHVFRVVGHSFYHHRP